MIPRAELERDVLIVACAVSAGIHAALTPAHAAEGAAAAAGFGLSAALLAGLAVVLSRHAGSLPVAGSAALLAGLVAGYVAAATTGLPILQSEPEPVTGLALFTKAVELAGLGAALSLLRPPTNVLSAAPRPKGTLT